MLSSPNRMYFKVKRPEFSLGGITFFKDGSLMSPSAEKPAGTRVSEKPKAGTSSNTVTGGTSTQPGSGFNDTDSGNVTPNACSQAEAKVNEALKTSSQCSVDSDCVVSDVLNLGCPFGCYSVVNKNAVLDQVFDAYDDYKKASCTQCTYKCMAKPTTEEIKCVNKQCVDTRSLEK